MFRRVGRSNGMGGKVGYHLALLALLVIITANLNGIWIRLGDYFGDPRHVYTALGGIINIGLVGYATGLIMLYWSAWRSGTLPDLVALILLPILPAAIPLMFVLPFLTSTWGVSQLYGIPLLWDLPQSLILGAGLAWLLLSAWLVTRGQGTSIRRQLSPIWAER